MTTPPTPAHRTASAPQDPDLSPIAHLQLKAALLLVLTLSLIVGAALYLLYARGVFEPTQRLVLIADDSEGASVGMEMTFSGFPIGRVRSISLADDASVRIAVDIPRRDAHWLRQSSVFTLVRGIVGGTTIKAYSGVLTDPPLEDGAERPVLSGDVTAEIPQLMASSRDLLDNLKALTAPEAALQSTLGEVHSQVRQFGQRLNAPGGMLGVLTGDPQDGQRLTQALQRNLTQTQQLLARLDRIAAKADRQLLGQTPKDDTALVPQLHASVSQAKGLLQDARASLEKLNAVLHEAQAVGAQAREASTDLGALRADVDANLRKVDTLLNDLQRQWPFARDTELRLP